MAEQTEPPDPMLQFFQYDHLPPTLREISRACAKLALGAVAALPRNAERTAGLRKLLEAKDCFVRARLFNPNGAPPPATDGQDVTLQVLQALERIEAGMSSLQGSAATDAAREERMAVTAQNIKDRVVNLQREITENKSVQASTVALLRSNTALLRELKAAAQGIPGGDELVALIDGSATELDAAEAVLAAAVVENTVAEGEPAPEPGGGTGQV
jgi:hypothetical protein